MPTQINNTASATFGFGRSETGRATSNMATTTLLAEFSFDARKIAPVSVFKPGDNVSYMILVNNNGTSSLNNVTIQDDMGGVNTPLSFVDGSGYLNIDGDLMQIDPVSTNPLRFVLPNAFPNGETAVLSYVATVNSGLSSDVTEITNSATVTAQDTDGGTVTISPNPSATITLEEYASIQMVKTVSSETISAGVPFSYYINLVNTGNVDAENVVIRDTLPQGFTINSITSESCGNTTTFASGEYDVDATTNTLTLPNATSVQRIVVPALIDGGDCKTIVTITGVIN